MHEASLMKGLIHQVESIALQQGAHKVVGIKVKLGALSHMSPEHFQEHFDQVSSGTLAEGAKIDAEVSTDVNDPNAMEVLIESIEVAE